MNIKRLSMIVLSTVLLSLAVSVTPGCVSSQDLRDKADQARQLSDNAGTLAAQIMTILENNPADSVEDSTVANMIRTAIEGFNADWVVYFDTSRNTLGDVRGAAIEFVNLIPALQDNLNTRADSLDQQADENASEFANTASLVINYGLALFGSGGVVTGVVSLINSVRNKRAAVSLIKGVSTVRDLNDAVDEAFAGEYGDYASVRLTPRARQLLNRYK
jgi:hypothetical protein